MIAWLPVASGMTWGLLMWLASYDSLTRQEAHLKKLLIVFFLLSSFAWFTVFAYAWLPRVFVLLNVPAYLAYLLVPIQFYRFIRALSDERGRRFSMAHYLLPFLLCGTLLVWSLFVPYEVNLALVEGRGALYPGQEAYSRLFLSKLLARVVFNMVYSVLSLVYLWRYYRQITRPGEVKGKHPSRWILLLMAVTLSLMVATLAVAIIPRGQAYSTVFILIPVLFQISQHLILVYNVLRRNFLPYTLSVHLPEIKTGSHVPERKVYTRYENKPISRKQLDEYMRKNKPFLHPQLKITDLADAMEVNRTYLSRFINRTYGMNFNAYINDCRLKELERIRKLPSNVRKPLEDLAEQVGFGSYRNYLRVRVARKENDGEKDD